jgi:hypothetical protein
MFNFPISNFKFLISGIEDLAFMIVDEQLRHRRIHFNQKSEI